MAKRGENIYKRKDKRWEGRFKCGATIVGKTAYKSVYASTYSECREKLKRVQSAYFNQPVAIVTESASKISFDILSQQWLIAIQPTVKASTYAVYSYIITHYLKALEHKKLEAVSESMVKTFVALLLQTGVKGGKGGLSVRTVSNILTILKAICSYGEKEYGCRSKVRNMKLPKQKMPPEKVLSESNWTKLTTRLEADRSETALAVAISLYTGMRLGEICALRVEDIQLGERVIQIRRTVQRVRTGETVQKTRLLVQTPKSEHSERTIPIPEVLCWRLAERVAQSRGRWYLLSQDGKKPLEPRTMQYRFQKYLKTLEIEAVNFHALRHTFATRCVERNVDMKTISEILGHGSVKTTLDRYMHSSMDFKRKQINRLSEAV